MENPFLFAKKSLGQHFLKNQKVVERMVEAAQIQSGDTVLEIGPGTGALTDGLLKTGAHVIALEADERAIETLKERFPDACKTDALVLHHADIRDVALTDYIDKTKPYAVVANIPYYLSGMLLRTTLSAATQPKNIVFLVQKEVAERIARSEKESLLSLSVKVFGTPQYIQTVARGNFEPIPAVDSAILAIDSISRNRFDDFIEQVFFAILHHGFQARRKQLLGNLSSQFTRETLTEIFTKMNIPLDVRGEDLSIDTWCALVRELAPLYKRT